MKEIVNTSEFEEVLKQEIPIVLDFYSENCNPCKSLMLVLDKLSFENKGKIEFLKTRADKNIELAKQFGVKTVPTLILIDRAKSMERTTGLVTEKALRIKLKELLN